jgi:hypothetical protein
MLELNGISLQVLPSLNSQIWKEIMLEMNSKPSSVTMFSTDFPIQNLVFWNLFEFSVAEII